MRRKIMHTFRNNGRLTALLLIGVLLMAFLGACQPITAEKATLPWRAELETGEEVSAASIDDLSETEATLVTRAIDDLAETLDVPADSITFVSIEAVDWPDASLGCPEPDMMYAAMLTSGYLITLSVGEGEDAETVEYHTTTSADSQLVQCDETQ
jgi:hypothetical protein